MLQTVTLPSIAQQSTYHEEVAHFLNLNAKQLHARRVHRELVAWDFKQRSTKANQAKLVAAEKAERATASDAGVYAILCALLQDSRFGQLDFESRRTLETAKRIFEEHIPRANDDPQFQPLRIEISETAMTLDRIKASVSDPESLAGSAPAGDGKPFAEQLRDLVIKRNQLASMRGFASYYHMRMAEDQMDFNGMCGNLTVLKGALDALLARATRVKASGLAPQRLSALAERVVDARTMLVQTAALMGVSTRMIESILETSDLFPRRYKNKFWFAFQIDPPFDVRASTNIHKHPEKLTATDLKGQLLHEVFGHGVDLRSISPDLHPLLRQQESFTAEAVALLSEELVFEPRWLQHVLAVSAGELRGMKPQLALLQLDSTVRSLRHGISTVEFEIEMYRNPTQDLDAAYAQARAWAQNTKAADYKAPSGIWALDVQHYISFPCYCHNYVLGRVWATQVRKSLRRRFGTYASRRVGPFMAKHRSSGLLYTPDEQIRQITNRPLTCDDLIADLDRLAALVEAKIVPATAA